MIGNLLLALGIILANGTNLYKKERNKQVEETPVEQKVEKRKLQTEDINYRISYNIAETQNSQQTATDRAYGFLNMNNVQTNSYTEEININGIKINGSYLGYTQMGRVLDPINGFNNIRKYMYIEMYTDGTEIITDNTIELYTMFSLFSGTGTQGNYYKAEIQQVDSTFTNIINNKNTSLASRINTIALNNYTHTTLETYIYTGTTYTDTGTYFEISEEVTINTNKSYYLIIFDFHFTDRSASNNQNIEYSITLPDTVIEVIDLPGLLFQILGMPFAFISQAFNLTLFPGTPYSINVSNLIFAIIIALLIIFIVRKVIR